jgi:hypothetical protein
MATRTLRHSDLEHSAMLDWALVLAGALFAWLCWPATHV